MMRIANRFRTLICLAVVLGVAPAARALPTVSVISPPTVESGASFSVDIRIEDVDAGSPLNAFELDLLFDASVLSPLSIAAGGFLLAPTFVLEETLGAVSVAFAELSLIPLGAIGDGVLATISFEAIGVGTSSLELTDLVLSEPFGAPIATADIIDGTVEVEPTSAIPEPSGLLLSLVGFGIAAACVPRRGC